MSESKIHLPDVPAMLLDAGAVDSINQGRATLTYAVLWQHGDSFDFDKKQVQVHRARLRLIGIDIKEPYNGVFFDSAETRRQKGIPEYKVRKNASKKSLKDMGFSSDNQ